jgi:hypothetical protein
MIIDPPCGGNLIPERTRDFAGLGRFLDKNQMNRTIWEITFNLIPCCK